MAKWADFLITEVKFNAAGTHIDKLKVHPDNGDTFGAETTLTRPQAVKMIQDGKTFMTVTRSVDGKLQKGAQVQIFPVSTDYLKTRADKSAADNLDNLPTF